MTKARRAAIAKQLEKHSSIRVDDCIIYKDYTFVKGAEYSLCDAKDGHTIDTDFRLDNLLDLFD